MINTDVVGSTWPEIENIATIDAYFSLFEDDLAGRKINKSAVYNQLSIQYGRSPGAYARKMSNISAILQDLGWPTMNGLKPADHYQKSLRVLLSDRLRVSSLDDVIRRSTQSEIPTPTDRYNLEFKPTPVLNKKNLVESNNESVILAMRDYLEIEASNRSLGFRGEELVVQHEKRTLRLLGEHALSERVEHVSQTKGDGLGYDVVSFEPSGKEKFIEVKTTNYGKYTPFFLTSNEVRVSQEINNQYHLYRLYNFRKLYLNRNHKVECYSLLGSLDNSVELDPISYRAYPGISGIS